MLRHLWTHLAVPVAFAVRSHGGAGQLKPLVTKVEHFCLVSADAEQLFRLFNQEFRLPVVWPFKSFGDFASGGLSVGNVVLEFVVEKAAGGAALQAKFKGIAFEPSGDAEAAVVELERRDIPHGEPEAFKYTHEGRERVGWVTVWLRGMPPAGAGAFVCDYKQRERVAEGRSKGSAELAASGGGPLGVTALSEIVLGVKSVEAASRDWGRLLGPPEQKVAAVFAIGSGPEIRLVQAESEEIQRIVVSVKSTAHAKKFLREKRMLGKASSRQLSIDPASVGGLMITLVEP